MSGLSDNMRAAIFMMVSMAGFSFNDAFIKLVSADLPLFEAVFLRGLIASLLLAGLALRSGAIHFRPLRQDQRMLGLRVIGEIGGTVCFLTALFHMPIANATAIMQSMPLAVTLAAAFFLGEPVGWRRYIAIGIGFFGVMIIVRPGAEGFNAYALWAVVAIGFIVLRDLSTRGMTPGAPALAVALVTSVALTLVAGVAALFTDLAPIAWSHVPLLVIAGLGLLVGYVFSVNAMRLGEIGFAQPFRYTLLLWAIVNGILLFGEWPDVWMLTGSAIIVGTGIYTFHRERRRSH